VAQYCLGDHGARASPWDVNSRGADTLGQDSATLMGLLGLVGVDWLYLTKYVRDERRCV
jgi:hypothetical protein